VKRLPSGSSGILSAGIVHAFAMNLSLLVPLLCYLDGFSFSAIRTRDAVCRDWIGLVPTPDCVVREADSLSSEHRCSEYKSVSPLEDLDRLSQISEFPNYPICITATELLVNEDVLSTIKCIPGYKRELQFRTVKHKLPRIVK
jgi:hypothetical protein